MQKVLLIEQLRKEIAELERQPETLQNLEAIMNLELEVDYLESQLCEEMQEVA